MAGDLAARTVADRVHALSLSGAAWRDRIPCVEQSKLIQIVIPILCVILGAVLGYRHAIASKRWDRRRSFQDFITNYDSPRLSDQISACYGSLIGIRIRCEQIRADIRLRHRCGFNRTCSRLREIEFNGVKQESMAGQNAAPFLDQNKTIHQLMQKLNKHAK